MDLLHRFFQLHRLLEGRRTPLPRRDIEVALNCSTSTAKRLIGELRNYGAPIEVVPGQGYRYRAGERFGLPGLGLSAAELSALLAARQLFAQFDGAQASPLAPLQRGVERVLAGSGLGAEVLAERVRIKATRSRVEPVHLGAVLEALVARQRLAIHYHGRARDDVTLREIAPQRLTRYRDNWHLDAWCYLRRDLRSFALERITHVRATEGPCDEVDAEVLGTWADAAYGIFNGVGREVAVLRFSATRARWAADEQWHPRQSGTFLPDGRFELRVPYAESTELVMDVMRLGDAVEVVAPPGLRTAVAAALEAAARRYRAVPE